MAAAHLHFFSSHLQRRGKVLMMVAGMMMAREETFNYCKYNCQWNNTCLKPRTFLDPCNSGYPIT